MRHLRDYLRSYFRERRHTALLVAIVTLFAVRPLIGDVDAAPIVFSIALLVVLLVALYTVQVDLLVGEREVLLVQRRRRRIVAGALAMLAVAERLIVIFAPNPRLYVLTTMSWLLFISFVTWSQWRTLLKQRDVTGETISMSISVYLLLGLSWSLVYAVIFERHPEAFRFGDSAAPASFQNTFPIWMYFSLTTLSTIGFGDITPVTLQARYLAVAEGITGQFYLAILVARLVAMRMNRAVNRDTGSTR